MSKEYCMINNIESDRSVSLEMRDFCKRPGKVDENGKIVYFTEQSHKDECDVNRIIRKYDKTGIISHVSRFEAQFGDVTGLDFQSMQKKILDAQKSFDRLPADIKKRFGNNAGHLLEFMDDPDNRDEAIKLGLIRADWTKESDGLGEHVKKGENVKKKDENYEGHTKKEN